MLCDISYSTKVNHLSLHAVIDPVVTLQETDDGKGVVNDIDKSLSFHLWFIIVIETAWSVYLVQAFFNK